jgi:hypothetical protein
MLQDPKQKILGTERPNFDRRLEKLEMRPRPMFIHQGLQPAHSDV